MTVLAIDAGTTGVTAVLITSDGRMAARGYQEFPQSFPRPGWVEHDPEQIWQATLGACRAALDEGRARGAPAPAALGLTNQRETAVFWRRADGSPARPAIVWQDRRTAGMCRELADAGHEDVVRRTTGLRLDPYFTATKLAWVREEDPDTWSAIATGDVVVGTVDSYLVARLTAGREHVTDPTNASRTLLLDIDTARWDDELLELFRVPRSALPELVPSSGELARTDAEAFLGLHLPIAGIAGDQQAALFGQACFDVGATKCTYGTGTFVLTNTGTSRVASDRLLTTIAWDLGDGTRYALEGSIFVTGAAVQWLRDGLGIIATAAQIEPLARSAPDSGGVVFVPSLSGMGAPHWDPDAQGAILGITRGTTTAHLARATLEAIALEVRDVVEVMRADAALDLPELSVDGGAAANGLLCQLQADQLGVAVRRPEIAETTALGAAFLAGLATGVWSSTDELGATWRLSERFIPGKRDDAAYRRWQQAVATTRTFRP